jgi:hypothetical protein
MSTHHLYYVKFNAEITVDLGNPYRVAAILIHQYGLSLEDAFIGVWRWLYPEVDLPADYYLVLRRVRRFKPEKYPPIPAGVKKELVRLRGRANPWERRHDPTYCRVCFRAPIWRRLRCQHCVRKGGWTEPNPCGVPGCGEPVIGKGRCRRHYQQAYRAGTLWKPANLHFVELDRDQYLL